MQDENQPHHQNRSQPRREHLGDLLFPGAGSHQVPRLEIEHHVAGLSDGHTDRRAHNDAAHDHFLVRQTAANKNQDRHRNQCHAGKRRPVRPPQTFRDNHAGNPNPQRTQQRHAQRPSKAHVGRGQERDDHQRQRAEPDRAVEQSNGKLIGSKLSAASLAGCILHRPDRTQNQRSSGDDASDRRPDQYADAQRPEQRRPKRVRKPPSR